MTTGIQAEDMRYYADLLWWIVDSKHRLGLENERSLSDLQDALRHAEAVLRQVAAEMPASHEVPSKPTVHGCIGNA